MVPFVFDTLPTLFTAEIKSSSQEDLVDLDQYDDDGNEIVPSVSGVVQYMMSHGDFPYGAGPTQPETGRVVLCQQYDNCSFEYKMKS